MDFKQGRVRMNVEGDRLSTLPDDIILKILALVGFKQAIQTSVLSSRWRYLWTSMPRLVFSDKNFDTLAKLSKFVKGVLSARNNQTHVFSVTVNILRFASHRFMIGILNKVLNYATSHNVQHLNIFFSRGHGDTSVSHFSYQSFKRLTSSSLTTLDLHFVTLYNDKKSSAGLFSNCANLKTLVLIRCNVVGSKGFTISHPRLSDLVLIHCDCEEGVNVFAPQLKHLTVRNRGRGMHLISAPNLTSFLYEGYFSSLQLSTDLLHLEKVNIQIWRPFEDKANAHKAVRLFQQLRSVKFLRLDYELVKFLSSTVELISHQPSPFANLKGLKIFPYFHYPEEQVEGIFSSTEVKKYLLGGSPGATVTIVLPKEVKAMVDTGLAQKLIAELRELLWQENASMETKMVKMQELGKVNISCWKHLSVQIEKGKEKASGIISKLEAIKLLMGNLPASNRATVQPSFSTLCAEADVVMKKITNCVKTGCDENFRRLSVCFHEFVTG